MINNVIKFKDYIASQLIDKKFRFKCECILPFDIIGIVKDYELNREEIIFIVEYNNKTIKIGENHPNLLIEEIK